LWRCNIHRVVKSWIERIKLSDGRTIWGVRVARLRASGSGAAAFAHGWLAEPKRPWGERLGRAVRVARLRASGSGAAAFAHGWLGEPKRP